MQPDVDIDFSVLDRGPLTVLPAADIPIEAPQHSWQPWRLDEMTAEPMFLPEIAGAVYRAMRHLISGEPDVGKGWLTHWFEMLELQSGAYVVRVDFEQGPAMTLSRLRALGITDEQLGRYLYLQPREPLDETMRADLDRLLERTRPTLVTFDAYAGLLGLHDADPNSERDIERVNRRTVDLFRRHRATTIILDHPVKSTAERGRYSSGNGRKLAECDVHIRVDRAQPFGRGRSGVAKLVNLKDRPGGLPTPRVGEFHLHSDGENVTCELRAPAVDQAGSSDPTRFRPTLLMERASVWIATQPAPVSRNQVETNVKGNDKHIRTALDVLTDEGYLAETEGPQGARLVASVRPYRQDDDRPRSTSADLGQTSVLTEDIDLGHRFPPLRGDEAEVEPATTDIDLGHQNGRDTGDGATRVQEFVG